jgi:hypothetical protein
MSLKLSYHNPAFPKDQEFDLGGVLVKNGSSITLSEEQELSMAARFGTTVKEHFKESEDVKVEGTAEVKAADIPVDGSAEEGGGS